MKIFPGKLRSRLALIYTFTALVLFGASFLIGFNKQKQSFQETILKKDRDLGSKAVSSLQLIYNNSSDKSGEMQRFLGSFDIRRLISVKILDADNKRAFYWKKRRARSNRRRNSHYRRRLNYRRIEKRSIPRKFDLSPPPPPPPRSLEKQFSLSFDFINKYFNKLRKSEELVRFSNTKTFVYKFSLADNTQGKIHLHFFTGTDFLNIIEKEFIAKMAGNFLVVSSTAIFIFIFIAFIVARSISKPLEIIAFGVKKVSEGDFKVDILPRGANEIKQLAVGFNDMKDSLLQKEKMRSQMTSDIAHELRTPITILRGEVEGMLDRVIKIDDHALRLLLDETSRLEQIVNSLKSIWDMEKEKSSLEMEPIDIVLFMEELITNFKNVAAKEDVILKYSKPDGAAVVMADRYHLSMALRNVVTNGIKYSGNPGSVTCSIIVDGSVRVVVSDNGNGISEQDRVLIFERFYRADASRNRKTGGAGLGLAIACEAMKSMSGNISVKNNSEGGAEFTLELPLA